MQSGHLAICYFFGFVLLFIHIMSLKSLSLHPKFAGFLDVIIGLLFLFTLKWTSLWWMLLIFVILRLLLWMVLVRLVYYPENIKRFWHLLTLLVFHLGTILLLLFIEWPQSWYLVGFIYLLFPFISFWLLPSKSEGQLSFVSKPYRRWRFWMSAFGLFGLWSGIFAAVFLQILNISYWFLLVSASIVTTAISMWWWREYNIEKNNRLWWWTVCIGVFILEIAWVLFRWPLGYFASALILVWFWYDIWLLARFHLLPAGIHWPKQVLFFIINGILLLSYLILIVKWK